MQQRLEAAYPEAELTVEDTAGDNRHFAVSIYAPQLNGLSRVAQHKAVMEVFHKEFGTGEVHALSIRIRKGP